MPDLTTSNAVDTFMGSADQAAMRTNLGLGTAATSDTGDFATAAQGALADSAVQPGDLGTAAYAATGDFATAAQGTKADTALQPDEVKSANFTAAINGSYVITASATVTDPSPVEGRGYVVVVRNGTATIGGVGYSVAGQQIRRIYHSGGWATYADLTEAALAAASSKTTPVDADTVPLTDSEASSVLKKVTWANIKATLKTYFDTLYQAAGSYLTSGGALGTPSSGTLTNCSGLPLGTGVSGQLPLANGGTGANLTDPNADRILFWDDSAGAVTWLTAGSGLTITDTTISASGGGGGGGSTNIFIGAGEFIPRTTNGCGINSLETSTNKVNYDVLEFDPAAIEYAQFIRVLPNNWNAGTITFKPIWTAASGSGDVVWQLSGRAYANDDAIDQASGTGQTSTDTLLAAGDVHIGPASSAITLGGTAANGNPVIFEISRQATSGSDTLAVDARLLGIEITYAAST